MTRTTAPGSRPRFGALSRFFKTSKGLLIIVLAGLAILAALGAGATLVGPGLAAAAATAIVIDAPLLRLRKGKWAFPGGALLTGLIVAMILSPYEPWHVAAITTAAGVLSKYLFRTHTANIFNPAALALVANYYVFRSGQSWWGALPDLPLAAVTVLIATGVYITDRVNRVPALLAFLGGYYLLFTVAAFVGDPSRVAALYRAPDLHAALFLAFFMVTDPPTSPPGRRAQLIFGAIAAVASFAVFEGIGAVHFLLSGLLVANGWEAWRRAKSRRKTGR